MAARALGEADLLSKEISYEPHVAALEIRKINFRNLLWQSLTLPDPNSSERLALPPQFFFGVPDWKASSVEDAARKSTSPIKVFNAGFYENSPPSRLSFLAPESIHAVFDFLKFPENYADPLNNFRERQPHHVGDIMHSGEGAMNYLQFLQDHFIAMGMCYPHDDPEAKAREERRISETLGD